MLLDQADAARLLCLAFLGIPFPGDFTFSYTKTETDRFHAQNIRRVPNPIMLTVKRKPEIAMNQRDQAYRICPSFCKINNFGDRLNIRIAELIFQPLLGHSFTTLADSEALKLYAVGSFLSADFLDKRNSGDRAIIAGMGAGYADLPVQQSFGFGRKFPVWIKNDIRLPLPKFVPETGKNYRILFVRGPLTARLLGLNTQDRFADAGYLLMDTDSIQRYKELRKSHISFMPHYTAASDSPGLRKICEDVGFQYIDPRGDIDEVLKAISSSSLLLTEALHGAVMSDVLRTPWIPLKSSEDVFEFKWIDFMASIGKTYTPAELKLSWKRVYYSGRNPVSLIKNLTTRVRSAVTRMLISPRETALSLMKASTLPPVLSSDASIVAIDSLISEKLDEFKESIKNATLFS